MQNCEVLLFEIMHDFHGNRMQRFQTEKHRNDFEHFVKEHIFAHSAKKKPH